MYHYTLRWLQYDYFTFPLWRETLDNVISHKNAIMFLIDRPIYKILNDKSTVPGNENKNFL